MQRPTHEQVREFNRFYTGILGLLDRNILDSRYSLAEARILFEINQRPNITASDLMISIKMDKGQMSRILEQFRKRRLVNKKKSKDDGRASFLSLTATGSHEFEKLNKSSNDQIRSLIKNLSSEEQEMLLHHMNEIRKIISKSL